MNKSWFTNGFKYIFCCIDVFSKKADMIPLKDREQTTTTKAFEKILDNMGIPKTIYSDQGSEFKNNTFQKLLDKHNIQIIFASGHAPFEESFNKTMKNRMMKYMKLKNTSGIGKPSKYNKAFLRSKIIIFYHGYGIILLFIIVGPLV